MRDELLASYVTCLLQPSQLEPPPGLDPHPNLTLVPQYLALLGQGLREALAHETFALLNRDLVAALSGHVKGGGGSDDASSSWASVDERCSVMVEEMSHWFGACLIRQQQRQYEEVGRQGGLTNHLTTTIRYEHPPPTTPSHTQPHPRTPFLPSLVCILDP